ncbi:MAG TPA: ABC transporter ATP-binding protein, partial [Kribbella sp.]|nr:ABC transporter ATP-binding protein [Kribbella sp.]
TTEDVPNQLTGTIRAFEFHGQQSIAFVQCGIEIVDPDRIGRPVPAHATSLAEPTPSLLARLRTRLRLGEPPAPAPEPHGPTHRRADLVVELPVDTGLQRGTRVHLALDTSKIHIFDHTGHRVDRVTR